MRIGIKLGGVVVGALILALGAVTAQAMEPRRQVQTVPLGGVVANQTGERSFGVYVPTRFGGELSIATSSGTVTAITGPDGRPRQNGREVGLNQHGWYTFKVTGAEEPYRVATRFVQTGESARQPWHFYYWPTKGDSVHEPWAGGNGRADTIANPYSDDIQVVPYGAAVAPGQDIVLPGPNGLLETLPSPGDDSTWFPNLYDDLTFRGADGTLYQTPAPLLKYDQIFGTSARAWEAASTQNHDIQRWPGHCLGAAVASIMLNEPVPAPGSGLTRDELKALWAELGENHYNHRIGDHASDIPPGPPRPGLDPCDRHVARFHNMLETHIRGRRIILLANLRAFPPRGTPTEVWNHGVGKYIASYHAIPGKGERSVRLRVELYANSGSALNGNDEKPRVITYEYTLVYGLDGTVDEANIWGNDWISVSGEALYAPLNLLEVVESRWQGHNPYVTEANVRSLDLANGGGGRLASSRPPAFQPVGNYEAGRPIFASGPGPGGSPFLSPGMMGGDPSRRGGILRFFGR